MTTYLVAGGCGFIGSNFVHYLLEREPDARVVVVDNLSYPDAAGYLDLPEGEYDLEIRPNGTTDVAFDIDPLPLAGASSYTVFAIGSLADGSFTVLPAVDASLMAEDDMAAEESPEA